MAAPEPGTTLAGKYVVERVLGIGGMGVVVAARHIQLDQKVAIKYLLPDALANPEVVERFAREARAAAKIRGEHVARVIDVGNFDDGAPFMVLEYLEGENLEELLERRGPLPVAEAVGYLLEACEALAEAHAAGIVHRDLKPANLFLARQPDRRSIVKVLDFGISKLVDPSGNGITKTSSIMGTPYYMSPEQLVASKGVDARSDIWALGVILYELVTNRKPFDGETLPEIVGAILTNEPERITVLRADVGLALELCLARCLASKAANRHASVKDLALALAPFAAADQQSTVEKIARVLGDSLAPSPPGDAAGSVGGSVPVIVAGPPPSGFASTAIVGSEEGGGSGVAVSMAGGAAGAGGRRAEGAEAGGVGAERGNPQRDGAGAEGGATKMELGAQPRAAAAVTAHAVSSGVEPVSPRRASMIKVGGGVALVVVGIGVVLGIRGGAPRPAATHDPVGGSMTGSAHGDPSGRIGLATGANGTGPVGAAADGTGAIVGVGSVVPAGAGGPAGALAASSPGVVSAGAAPSPSAAVALSGATPHKELPPATTSRAAGRATAAPPPSASTPAVAATTSTSKNPLQMGIK